MLWQGMAEVCYRPRSGRLDEHVRRALRPSGVHSIRLVVLAKEFQQRSSGRNRLAALVHVADCGEDHFDHHIVE